MVSPPGACGKFVFGWIPLGHSLQDTEQGAKGKPTTPCSRELVISEHTKCFHSTRYDWISTSNEVGLDLFELYCFFLFYVRKSCFVSIRTKILTYSEFLSNEKETLALINVLLGYAVPVRPRASLSFDCNAACPACLVSQLLLDRKHLATMTPAEKWNDEFLIWLPTNPPPPPFLPSPPLFKMIHTDENRRF